MPWVLKGSLKGVKGDTGEIAATTANRALISDSSGHATASPVTSTELGYLDGVSSNVQTQLNGKAASSHSHQIDDVSGLQDQLDGKSPTGHTHTIANVANLQTTLDGKAPTNHEHSVDDLTDFPTSMPASDVSSWAKQSSKPTYTYSEVGAAAASHEHEIEDVDGLQTALNGKAASSHTHANATTGASGFLPKLGGGTTNYLRADGTWAKPPDTNTTYGVMGGASSSDAGSSGLVPAPAAGAATRYLRSDGTWQVPPDTNTTYNLSSFGITATAAELNKLDGVTATATEINYVDGVTSNIQTQLNSKAASSHTHTATQVTGLTANRALVSNSSGQPAVSAVTSTELGYLDGVTSNVQTQLNNKAPKPGVGMYCLCASDVNPASLYGGTWAKITDTYLFLGITLYRRTA